MAIGSKEFLINAVDLVPIKGSSVIPTAVLYKGGRAQIGRSEIQEAQPGEVLRDFKIELGEVDPGSASKRKKHLLGAGLSKTASEAASDFFFELLTEIQRRFGQSGVTGSANLLIAEPLSLQSQAVSEKWLANYRNALRRIISGKRITADSGFASIDFLPEPFAVFQYYRYGLRHPLVAQRSKFNALVIDFGGGTCDVCIIETTREGDISQSGRASRPLAAQSEAIGGFQGRRISA
jgi:hypothetical protein